MKNKLNGCSRFGDRDDFPITSRCAASGIEHQRLWKPLVVSLEEDLHGIIDRATSIRQNDRDQKATT
jgi:hypothetical protein